MNKHFHRLLLAAVISTIWVFAAGDMYGYNYQFAALLGLNLFPLVCWAIGLFLAHSLFVFIEKKHKFEKFVHRFAFFLVFYWVLLILAETIGYHVFNVHNIATAIYAGLPICNCMHAPLWMQIVYFSLGPIFFAICRLLGLD